MSRVCLGKGRNRQSVVLFWIRWLRLIETMECKDESEGEWRPFAGNLCGNSSGSVACWL